MELYIWESPAYQQQLRTSGLTTPFLEKIQKRSRPKMEQEKNQHRRYSIVKAFSRKPDEAESEEYRRQPCSSG